MASHRAHLVLVVCVFVALAEAVIRPTATLNLMEGEGFIAYLEVPKSFGEIKNCWFKFRGSDKVKIELNTSVPIVTERGEHILPFSERVCGIRVDGISTASAAVWTLEAENNYGDYEQDTVTIHILPMQRTNFDTRVQMEIGKGTIRCSKHESYTKHCKIVDVYYGGTYHQCDVYTSIHPSSMFECYMYNWGRMEQTHQRIFVDIPNSTYYTNATMDDGSRASVLRCEFQDKVFSCQAEMPDHTTELFIMDGVYNGHYSALDTMTSKSKCSLEVPKPFKESEIGLWRILNYESSTPTGCIFYLGKSKQDIILSELSQIPELTTVNAYSSDKDIEEISCSVPFVISDCYLRDPNNTIYFPDSIRFERQRMYGKCAFYRVPVVGGVWTCGARGRDYDSEVVQKIEVRVKSKYGETLTDLLKAKRGDAVELMCKSSFEEPISHCVFVGPNGDVFLVATVNSVKTKGHVQYYGRGINKGECGIKISGVTPEDYGQWRCQFIVYSGRQQSSFAMELKEMDTANATTVGLGVGLTVIIVLILGVVIGTVFYRRRNMSARHNFVSAESVEMPTTSTTH